MDTELQHTDSPLADYVSVPEIADAMGLNRQNVYDRVKDGRLKAVAFGPRAKAVKITDAIEHFGTEASRSRAYADQLDAGCIALGRAA
jgi:predicted DNA-binding protein YlxM (UPF0122 family)